MQDLHIEDRMFVVPVPFSIEGAKMLQHTKWLLEEPDGDDSSLIAIHKERSNKLVTALRTAVANELQRIQRSQEGSSHPPPDDEIVHLTAVD
jgi:hypothetical protein